jgi:hypothetical protein
MNSNLTGKSVLSGALQPKGSVDKSDVLWQSRSLLLIASAITVALMFLPYSNIILYPLRLFVTFIHESGHALAALISGGSVESLTVMPNGEGVTMTRDAPWAAWLVLSGGYLGTTIFGALLLQVGRLKRWQNAGRATLYAAAAFLLTVTLLWGHNPFTLLAGIVLAALLGGLARISAPRVANFIASFLAVQCCLNALGDLRILLYLTTNTRGDNDAVFMQQQYLLPAVFWASLWAVMAVIILALALRSYWRGTEERGQRIAA